MSSYNIFEIILQKIILLCSFVLKVVKSILLIAGIIFIVITVGLIYWYHNNQIEFNNMSCSYQCQKLENYSRFLVKNDS